MNDGLALTFLVAIGGLLLGLNFLLAFSGAGNKLGDQRGDEKKDRYTTRFVMIGLFAIVFSLHAAGFYRRLMIERGLWTGAAALALAGAALRISAIHTLEKLFTFEVGIRPEHRIVEEGPYRWLRHPGYAGYVLFALGVSVANAFSLGLVLWMALLLVVYGLRIRNEEQALLEHFGEAYRAYMARTARLVPFVF